MRERDKESSRVRGPFLVRGKEKIEKDHGHEREKGGEKKVRGAFEAIV